METENEGLYKSYDENWQRLYFDADSQGFVVAHKRHGQDELPLNLAIVIRLAKHFGEKIELLRAIISTVNIDKNNRVIQIDLLLSNNKLVSLSKELVRKRDFKAFYAALLE
jgi:hypothetical protein